MAKIALVILAMLLLVIVPLMADAQAETTAVVTADWLNLRRSGRGTEVVIVVPEGTFLSVLGVPDVNGYYPVCYEGQTLTAHGDYLDFATQPTTADTSTSIQGKAKTVKAELYAFNGLDEDPLPMLFVSSEIRLALRADDEYDARILAWLPHGAPVFVVRPTVGNGFVKVRCLDGMEGYAHTGYLSTQPIGDCVYIFEEEVVNGISCWADIAWQEPPTK